MLFPLVFGGVIERDGGMIKQSKAMPDGQPTRTEDQMPASSTLTPQVTPAVAAMSTSFSAAPNTNGATGGLSLNVNISVDMMQMATWPPQTVTAFMQGLAQVITAKAAAEASTTR